jgi:pimeloyl-ACP methyl ester carboxylesterase
MAACGLLVSCADGQSVRVWTEGEGRPLLVLHGWGLDGHAYRAALRGFASAGYKVFAPTTNVAVGRRWSLTGLAGRVAAVCDALGIASCPVVGHSFGGVIAAKLALDFPDRVSALVVVNSALVSPGLWKLCRLAVPGAHYRLAADRRVLYSFARAQSRPATLAHLAGSVRWMLSTDLASQLPKLRQRCLPSAVLWALDRCLPEVLGHHAAELMGARFLAIAGEGRGERVALDHIWPLSSPEMFVERVVAMVEQLAPRAALRSKRSLEQ